MAARNISATVQIGASMGASVGSVFGGIKKRIDGLGASMAKLKRSSSEITKLQTAQAKLAQAQAKGNAAGIKRYSEQIEKLSSSLREAGVDTSRLAQEQSRLNSQLDSSGRRMANLTRLQGSVGKLGTAFGNVKAQVMGLGSKLAILGAGVGYVFKRQFVDTAAEFERLQSILVTLEGGNVQKAQQAFGWISDFAAKTPYDLLQVTEAFKQLRTFGIDPIKGDTLRTLGDTAAAMGKPIMQVVEAIADAVTGENERLKELGVKAAKDGGRTIFSYVDRAGKQRRKSVETDNQAMILDTLKAIWNEKYAGAMEAQSKTWAGMISNLGDQWTRFTAMVMASGLFDWMKDQLGSVLNQLDEMAKDGSLKAWAKETGTAIKEAFIAMKDFAVATKDVVTAVAGFVGGWRNLGAIIAGIALAPTIASVFTLGKALWSVAAAVFAIIGPWAILIGAVIASAVAVWYYWEPIKKFFIDLWAGISGDAAMMWDTLTLGAKEFKDRFVAVWESIKASVGAVIDWIGEKVSAVLKLPERIGQAIRGSTGMTGDYWTPGGAAPLDAAGIPGGSIMPPERMPAASGGGTVNNKVDVTVNVPPGADGKQIANGIRSNLSRPLFDQTGVLAPQ